MLTHTLKPPADVQATVAVAGALLGVAAVLGWQRTRGECGCITLEAVRDALTRAKLDASPDAVAI